MSLSQDRTVGITGASGYLGHCLTKAFRSVDWEVRPLNRRRISGGDGDRFELGKPIKPASLRGMQALVHCAYDLSLTQTEEIRRVNVEGSRYLFAAAREAGVPYLVYISSISAFPGCRSVYGQAKLAIEEDAREAGAMVLRPGLIWGDAPGGMFGKLTTQVAGSRIIPLVGDGSQVQYLVHDQDLAQFIVGHCTGRVPGIDIPVTVAHHQPWPFAALLRAIGRGMGREPRLFPVPWRAVWAGVRAAELLRLPLGFRSDSVISLMNQNRAPDFRVAERLGVVCRPFSWRPAYRDGAGSSQR
jgi:nucleoside-diphosphate-sugar epimerase